jgi:hypothetical protein
MRRLFLSAFGLAAATFAITSGAHHSTNLGYDVKKTITVSGEFVDFKWMNPHAVLRLNVVNARGEKELWSAETHGATVLGRFGWRPTMFKPGEKLTLVGNPPQKPEQKTLHMLQATVDGGKSYSVNEKNPY